MQLLVTAEFLPEEAQSVLLARVSSAPSSVTTSGSPAGSLYVKKNRTAERSERWSVDRNILEPSRPSPVGHVLSGFFQLYTQSLLSFQLVDIMKTDDTSINPNLVESGLDSCRFNGDSEGVLNGLKRYARIFDVGAATSTFQHGNVDAVRAYYWSVMAESVYETKRDYYNAIDCARRAVGLDENCIEARVIVSRILLESCQTLLCGSSSSSSENAAKIAEGSIVELDAASVLQVSFESLTEDAKKTIRSILNFYERSISAVVLAVLQFMPPDEVAAICSEVATASTTIAKGTLLVLVISRVLLSAVVIGDIAARNNAGGLSEYRLWLFLDASATTVSIYEACGDVRNAREHGSRLLSAGMSLCVDGNSSGSGPFTDVPESCRNVILAMACRLGLIERAVGMVDVALNSFHRCISGDSPLRYYFPVPIQLGLNVEAALMMLARAKETSGGHHTSASHQSSFVVDYPSAAPSVQRDIDHAFSLLSSAQHTMTAKVDLDTVASTNYLKASGLDPLPRSQLHSLPSPPATQPRTLATSASSSVISTLIAAIIKLREPGDSAKSRSVEVLEWGISLEIAPRPDLLWSLAGACVDGGRWTHAIELFEQCYFSLMAAGAVASSSSSKGADGRGGVDELLRWLGAGESPSGEHGLWLPLARACEVSSHGFGDSLTARMYARRALLEVYDDAGLGVIEAVGSDQADLADSSPLSVLDFEYGSSSCDKYRNTADTLTAPMSLPPGTANGLCMLTFLLGRSHGEIARGVDVTDSSRVRHLRVAVKALDLLLRYAEAEGVWPPSDEEEVVEEVILHQAVCLAELGEVTMALALTRSALSADRYPTSSRLLHLTALLLAASGDNAAVLGTAAAFCKQAVVAPVTSTVSVTSSSSSSSSSRSGRSTRSGGGVDVDDISLSMNEVSLRSPSGRSPKTGAVSSTHSPNARLTLALIDWAAGNTDHAIRALDHIIVAALADFRVVQNWQHTLREAAVAAGAAAAVLNAKTPNPDDIGVDMNELHTPEPSAVPEEEGIRLDSPPCVRGIIHVLLTCGRLYERASKLSKAKAVTEEAWRVLFLPDKTTFAGIGDLLVPTAERHVTPHRRVDLLRRVPTLAGWRLSEASGWGRPGYPDLEAAVLCEIALQAEDVASAVELLNISLVLCPHHTPSLVALADIELKRLVRTSVAVTGAGAGAGAVGGGGGGGEDPVTASAETMAMCRESRAGTYATAAVRARDLDPESWHVMGRVHLASGHVEEAEAAFATAKQCTVGLSLRPFAVVLEDQFIRPLAS